MSQKVNVLHIIKTLGLGGAETNLLNLARAIDTNRFETHVAYSDGGEIEPRFRQAGVTLFKYANASHRVKSLHSILIVLRLAAYIRRHRIAIVHTHNFNGHIWGLLAAKLTGAKLIEHVHDFRYVPANELALRHGLLDQYRFIKYFRKRSDLIVVLTRANLEYVIDRGFATRDRVVQIENGISFEVPGTDGVAVRARFGFAHDAVVVLTSARMDPSKNIDLILRVASRLAVLAPDVLFVVAGSGTHLAEYENRCKSLHLERQVRFIGFQTDIDSLLSAADIFLLPSFLELHSIAILEATRMKVPIVISRGVGCNDEFVEDGVDGFLCDPFAEDEWVEALTRLSSSSSYRRQVGEAGYVAGRRLFDISVTARRIEAIYTKLGTDRRAH